LPYKRKLYIQSPEYRYQITRQGVLCSSCVSEAIFIDGGKPPYTISIPGEMFGRNTSTFGPFHLPDNKIVAYYPKAGYTHRDVHFVVQDSTGDVRVTSGFTLLWTGNQQCDPKNLGNVSDFRIVERQQFYNRYRMEYDRDPTDVQNPYRFDPCNPDASRIHRVPVGVIVGAVLGGTFLLLIIATLVYRLVKRRKIRNSILLEIDPNEEGILSKSRGVIGGFLNFGGIKRLWARRRIQLESDSDSEGIPYNSHGAGLDGHNDVAPTAGDPYEGVVMDSQGDDLYVTGKVTSTDHKEA